MGITQDIINRIMGHEQSSLDEKWSKSANTRLIRVDGKPSLPSGRFKAKKGKRDHFVPDAPESVFFADEEEANDYARLLGENLSTVSTYDIFCPDALIKRVSGRLSRPRKNKHLIAYTDGSFVDYRDKHVASYGVFATCDEMAAEFSNTIVDNTFLMCSLGGELAAAIVAIKVAIAYGFESVEIRYDCTGVSIFDEGSRRSPKPSSRSFWLYEQYQSFLDCVKDKIDVTFTKVKAHSCDVGNEHANFLAHTHAKRAAKTLQYLVDAERRKQKAKAKAAKKKAAGKQGASDAGKSATSDAATRDEGANKPVKSLDGPWWVPMKDAHYKMYDEAARLLSSTIAATGKKPVTLKELEQAFLDGCYKERLALESDEHKYLRLIACGAKGKAIRSYLRISATSLADIRKRVSGKLGIEPDSQDEQVLKRLAEVVLLGAGVDSGKGSGSGTVSEAKKETGDKPKGSAKPNGDGKNGAKKDVKAPEKRESGNGNKDESGSERDKKQGNDGNKERRSANNGDGAENTSNKKTAKSGGKTPGNKNESKNVNGDPQARGGRKSDKARKGNAEHKDGASSKKQGNGGKPNRKNGNGKGKGNGGGNGDIRIDSGIKVRL